MTTFYAPNTDTQTGIQAHKDQIDLYFEIKLKVLNRMFSKSWSEPLKIIGKQLSRCRHKF